MANLIYRSRQVRSVGSWAKGTTVLDVLRKANTPGLSYLLSEESLDPCFPISTQSRVARSVGSRANDTTLLKVVRMSNNPSFSNILSENSRHLHWRSLGTRQNIHAANLFNFPISIHNMRLLSTLNGTGKGSSTSKALVPIQTPPPPMLTPTNDDGTKEGDSSYTRALIFWMLAYVLIQIAILVLQTYVDNGEDDSKTYVTLKMFRLMCQYIEAVCKVVYQMEKNAREIQEIIANSIVGLGKHVVFIEHTLVNIIGALERFIRLHTENLKSLKDEIKLMWHYIRVLAENQKNLIDEVKLIWQVIKIMQQKIDNFEKKGDGS